PRYRWTARDRSAACNALPLWDRTLFWWVCRRRRVLRYFRIRDHLKGPARNGRRDLHSPQFLCWTGPADIASAGVYDPLLSSRGLVSAYANRLSRSGRSGGLCGRWSFQFLLPRQQWLFFPSFGPVAAPSHLEPWDRGAVLSNLAGSTPA